MASARIGSDLTQGSIFKTLIKFAFPILLTNLVQQLYNTVDLIVIGRFVGSVGTVGVSTGGDVVNMLTNFAVGFSSAGEVYISQLSGAREYKKISGTMGTIITTMTGASVFFAVISIAFCGVILRLLNCPADAFVQARGYMIITAVGLPFIYGYNALCACLRGMGESKKPFLFVLIAATSNIFLDLLLVVVFRLEAVGTAIATVAAQMFSFAAAFIFLYRNREHFDFDFKPESFKIHGDALRMLLKLGVPRAIQMCFINVSQMFCNSLVNSYGLVESAVNSVGNKITRFCNIITMSIDTSAAVMVGQNLGAQRIDRAKQAVYCAFKAAMAMMVVNILLAVFIPDKIFAIFNNDPDVVALGTKYMRISIMTFILAGIMGPFQAVVTGSGNAMLNFFSGMLDSVVLRIGISLILTRVFGMGVEGFFYGNSLARLAPTVINTWYFFSGRWTKRRLVTKEE